MAFHVNWKPSAIQSLTEIWIAAKDRKDVGRAAGIIDEALRSDPDSFGEQRSGMLRLGFALPLAVMFEVFPEDLRVDVIGIKRIDHL